MAIVLLTAEQAAERLGICERTLRKLRQRGEIAYIAVTEKRFRYTPEDCDAYLAARRRIQKAPCQQGRLTRERTTMMQGAPSEKGFMDLREARRMSRRGSS